MQEKSARRPGVFAPKSGRLELTDLDKAILGHLPDEGSKRGKYLPEARTVAQLKKLLADGELTSGLISGRLRLMATVGLTTSVPIPGGDGGGRGWQKRKAADSGRLKAV
jgi:hypothetical protein